MREKIEELFSSARTGADTLKQTVSVKKAIKDCEDSLAVMMYDLGCETYEARMTGKTDEEAIKEIIEEVTDARTKLKSLHSELNALSGKTECPGCGKLTSNDYDYCPFCGTKLYDVVIDEDDKENKKGCCCEGEKADAPETCCCENEKADAPETCCCEGEKADASETCCCEGEKADAPETGSDDVGNEGK